MIAANVAAAETLEKHKSAADLPRPRLAEPREADGARGVPRLAQPALRQSRRRCGPPTSTASSPRRREAGKIEQVSEMVLRSQAQAEYSAENYGHFGLNLDRYAHFTSPIRRYADLIVHRALIAALDFGKDGLREARGRGAARHRPAHLARPSAAPWRPSARPPTGCWRSSSPGRSAPSSRAGSPASPARASSSGCSTPAPTASSRPRRSARTTTATSRSSRRWSATAPARRFAPRRHRRGPAARGRAGRRRAALRAPVSEGTRVNPSSV